MQVFCEEVKKGNPIYVITGGPGFGKSALTDYLKKLGYKTGEESAREIIREQRKIDGDILPEKNIRLFQNEVLKRRLEFYQSVGNNEIAFADRAIPDQIAFTRFKGFDTPEILARYANECRYNEKVFITPPWKEIYKNDTERTEPFEKSYELHYVIVNVYEELGYSLIELPYADVPQRAEFILNLIV
ncbi:MAG: AAA family ATPase [Prolixibacteraceae bacterium]|jgi:predicted ATPase|nr:AAA family ATPase [Prolixibacteraceae bacterium]